MIGEAKELRVQGNNVKERWSRINLPLQSLENCFDYQGMALLSCATVIAHMPLVQYVGHLLCICARLHAALWSNVLLEEFLNIFFDGRVVLGNDTTTLSQNKRVKVLGLDQSRNDNKWEVGLGFGIKPSPIH